MVEIKVTGATPLEALSSVVALGMHCMQVNEVCAAANRILEAEQRREQKPGGADMGRTEAMQATPQNVPDTPKAVEQMENHAVGAVIPAPATATAAPAPAVTVVPVQTATTATPAPDVGTPAPTPAAPGQTVTAACPSDVGAAAVAPAKVFTVEEVARAIAGHLTAHPEARSGLMGLLQSYQLASIADLKPEQCGAFATALRAMGVNI